MALILACLGFAVYERASFRAAMSNKLLALADTLGANTAASLTFNDRKSARDMLGALQAERQITATCLYDTGELFVEIYPGALCAGRPTRRLFGRRARWAEIGRYCSYNQKYGMEVHAFRVLSIAHV
jgi:hypothetical protein